MTDTKLKGSGVFKLCFLLQMVFLGASPVSAGTFRQDFGYYQASQIWMGTELMDFANLDETASSGSVSTIYSVSSYSFDVEKGVSEARVHARVAQSTMNEFSAARTPSGDSMAGLAEIGVGFSRVLQRWGQQVANWSLDFQAPGDANLSPYQFNAITNGQPQLKFGLDYSYLFGSGSFSIALSYAWRFGTLDMVNVNDAGTLQRLELDVPDVIALEMSLPFYFGSNYAGFLFSHEQALSGMDVGSDQFMSIVGEYGRAPFPATREVRTFVGAVFGMVVGSSSTIDATVNTQINGRNTDKGIGFNLGFSSTFE